MKEESHKYEKNDKKYCCLKWNFNTSGKGKAQEYIN